MDDSPPRRRRPAFAVLGLLFAVGAVALAVRAWTGGPAVTSAPVAIGLLGLAAICFVLYWNPGRRDPVYRVPRGVPPDRAFKVTLRAKGGWLSRYLAPDTEAYLVILDDELRLSWRRQHREVSLAFWMLILWGNLPWLNPRWMLWPRMAGTVVLLALEFWFLRREIDVRYPWARVHSVSVADTRFLIRVEDDEFPDGFLVQVPIALRKPIAALFASRTSFQDTEAALAKEIRERA